MKSNKKIPTLIFILFFITTALIAQNSGTIVMTNNDWNVDYYYTAALNVTPNTPIRINYKLNTNDYLEIQTSDNGSYRQYISAYSPTNGYNSITVISTTGVIYIYSEYSWNGMSVNPVFEINYAIDPSYTVTQNPSIIQNDQFIAGKLGVGVNPIEKFEVNGSARISNRLSVGSSYTNNSTKLYVQNNTDNYGINSYSYRSTTSSLYGIYTFTGNPNGNVYGLYSSVSGTEGKRWAGYFNGGDVSVMNGNLSAGVEKPLGILHVRGTRDNAWIYFASNAGFTKPNPHITYGMAFTWNLSGSEEESIINYSGSNNARLDFTSWNGTSLKTEMTLRQGNLGIGTTSPTSKLHIATVNGEGIRIGKIGDAGNINVPIDALSSQYNIDFTGFRDIANDQIGARISALRFNCYQANNAYVQKTGLAFYTNPKGENTGTTDLIERMRIAPDGKIGIGTDTPDHLLTVKGTIHAREVLVDLNGPLADYVFEPDYTLMPLSEVESFVKANKHLPEIPSAAEVKENGLNMGEMQNKLLQKIEELTLYVIELQKTNEKQNAEIEALKQVKK